MATTHPRPPAMLAGTLELMILAVVGGAPAHGYAIAREIEKRSGGDLRVEEGSLYPALRRLVGAEFVGVFDTRSSTGRRVRVYRITPAGRKHLAELMKLWQRLRAGVDRVVEPRDPMLDYLPNAME